MARRWRPRQAFVRVDVVLAAAVALTSLVGARAFAGDEFGPTALDELPTAALEEVFDAWRSSPAMASEMVRRMAGELRAASAPSLREGPLALEALARALGDPKATEPEVLASLQAARVALAAHHARNARFYVEEGLPAHGATELGTAAGYLDEAAAAAGDPKTAAAAADGRAAAEAVLEGRRDTRILTATAGEVRRAAEGLARAR